MAQRLRLLDVRLSRLAQSVGICQGDIASIAQIVNAAQERLVTDMNCGEVGWFGSSARTVFNVNQLNPYITLPRWIARIEMADVCNRPVAIQNDWYQFIEFGIGLQHTPSCQLLSMYRVGNFPTAVDIATTNQTVRVFMTDAGDVGKRVLIQGEDAQGQTIRSQDGLTPTLGEYLTLGSPFVQFPIGLSKITGIQKDVTIGPVQFYQVDLTSGATVPILTMEPSETTAWYPRYQITGLPRNCCHNNLLPNTAQITAMAKLELIPVQQDSDWLLIQSLEALISECQAVRFESMDSGSSDQKSALKHRQALGFLQGQITHLLGQNRPAVVWKPFGSATLRRRRIGTLT